MTQTFKRVSWLCSNCNYLNFINILICKKCGELKDSTHYCETDTHKPRKSSNHRKKGESGLFLNHKSDRVKEIPKLQTPPLYI